MKKTINGFTIVELLIVIVVIAILATISIVAYNGIQTRAENTKTNQAVTQYVKALASYAVLNNTYYVTSDYPCLGGGSLTCGNMTDTSGPCNGSGQTQAKALFDTAIRTVISGTLPQPSSQQMNCGGKMYSGAYYYPSTGKTAQIIFFLKGNQTCDGVGGTQVSLRDQIDDTTRCVVSLPALP